MNTVLVREYSTDLDRLEAALTAGGMFGDWRILARTHGGIIRRRLCVLPPPLGLQGQDALEYVTAPDKVLLKPQPLLRRLGLALAALLGRRILVQVDRAAFMEEVAEWRKQTRAD